MNMNLTYWNHNGKHQQYVNELNSKIPLEGSVPNKLKNKALERFRVASNCYYDLYNNGLCNRAIQFSKIFKIRAAGYRNRQYRYSPTLYAMTEIEMDEIVIAAAIEQGLCVANS